MRKSIFTRYISAFLLIVFISFTILTLIITSMTIRSSNKKKETVALNTSRYISAHIVSECAKLFPHSTAFDMYMEKNMSDISSMINILSKNAEAMTIFIVSSNGKILLSTDSLYSGDINDKSILDIISNGARQEMYTTNKLYTDMNGLLDGKNGVYVTPFADFSGALIVCYGTGELDELALGTTRTIIIASIWVMIASFIAIYFISEKIVSPIKKMRDATKRFSEGQFDIKIPVDGSDEIAELATAFNSMADSLANLEYTRSSFLANLSHDLRTPMTSISGFIDSILAGAIPPEKQPYYLNMIRQEIRRLSRLVTDLLDLSRLESGNKKFETSTFDICETARLILISFETKIDEKKLNVEFDAPDSRLYVSSDKDVIYRVLYNITDNAVKFSKDRGILRIKINESGQKVFITIYNEGVGISVNDISHVFDRFYKSDKSRGLDKTGVGLGLYIAKTMMNSLKEELSVKSVQNEYCEFTMSVTKHKGKLPPQDTRETGE